VGIATKAIPISRQWPAHRRFQSRVQSEYSLCKADTGVPSRPRNFSGQLLKDRAARTLPFLTNAATAPTVLFDRPHSDPSHVDNRGRSDHSQPAHHHHRPATFAASIYAVRLPLSRVKAELVATHNAFPRGSPSESGPIILRWCRLIHPRPEQEVGRRDLVRMQHAIFSASSVGRRERTFPCSPIPAPKHYARINSNETDI